MNFDNFDFLFLYIMVLNFCSELKKMCNEYEIDKWNKIKDIIVWIVVYLVKILVFFFIKLIWFNIM